MRMMRIVSSFRNRGHYAARLGTYLVFLFRRTKAIYNPIMIQDPLSATESGVYERRAAWLPKDPNDHPDIVRLLRDKTKLDLSAVKLSDVDPDKQYYLGKVVKVNNSKDYWSINGMYFRIGTHR